MAVIEDEVLTIQRVVSIMRAVLAGEMTRVQARVCVEPWVEGDEAGFEPGALSGATVIHGIDLVRDQESGLAWHSSGANDELFAMSDDEVRTAFSQWVNRFGGAADLDQS